MQIEYLKLIISKTLLHPKRGEIKESQMNT